LIFIPGVGEGAEVSASVVGGLVGSWADTVVARVRKDETILRCSFMVYIILFEDGAGFLQRDVDEEGGEIPRSSNVVLLFRL